ncbi:MAG: transposase [Candidatus Wildermuthbacteria bacterium]|nr:transposase [Candidatus Wildermuthbacteria bacterium]
MNMKQKRVKVLRWDPDNKRKPRAIGVEDAFELITLLKRGDDLWLRMGSTNAAVALGAFRRGIMVHQISYPRAMAHLGLATSNAVEVEDDDEDDEEGFNGANGSGKIKIMPEHIYTIAKDAPDAFYPVYAKQAEALSIIAAEKRFEDSMKLRIRGSNITRARLQEEAVIYGTVKGHPIENKEEVAGFIDAELGAKDEKGKKLAPADPRIQMLMAAEDQAGRHLDAVMKDSPLVEAVFGSIDGVGSRIGARFIRAIERIERFPKSHDLLNYAGMVPRGPQPVGGGGKLMSRRASRGQMLARRSQLNMACRLFQDQIFGFGRKTPFGQELTAQIERECPCTPEQRKESKELRIKHMVAVKRARINITRSLLKTIYRRWRDYMRDAS